MVRLTDEQKIAIRLRLSQMHPDDRLSLIGQMRSSLVVPADVVAFFESVNVELRRKEEERIRSVRGKSAMPEVRELSPEEVRAFWGAVKHGLLFLSVSGGVVAAFYYVIIPGFIAVGRAFVIAAPYILAGIVCILGFVSFVQSLRRVSDENSKPSGPEVLVRTTTITETFRQ